MNCPNCGHDTKGKSVIRTVRLSREIIRERKCKECGWKWATVQPYTAGEERVAEKPG